MRCEIRYHGCMEKPKQIPEDVQRQYMELRSRWEGKVAGSSSLIDKEKHPDFQAIVAMGEKVIPVIFEDLVIHPSWIVLALWRIRPDGPEREPVLGEINKMIKVWLEWGIDNKLIEPLDLRFLDEDEDI